MKSGSMRTTSMPSVRSVRSCPAWTSFRPLAGAQQLGNIRRHQLDDMLLKRLPRIQRRGFAHGLFGPVRVAAPKLGEASDPGPRHRLPIWFRWWAAGVGQAFGGSVASPFSFSFAGCGSSGTEGRAHRVRRRSARALPRRYYVHRRHRGEGGCVEDVKCRPLAACAPPGRRSRITGTGDARMDLTISRVLRERAARRIEP